MDLAIEEMSLSGWPALQTCAYDGWLLRFAEGYTKRSNSVNALYRGRLDLAEKIDACEAAYSARGLPTIFKVLDERVGGAAQLGLDAALARRGYERIDETAVRTMELGPRFAIGSRPRPRVPAGIRISVEPGFTPAWIGGMCACSKLWAKRELIAGMLANSVPDIAATSARSDAGGIVGCGYGAMERGWVGLFDIAVKEEWRRRGIGEAIVGAILEESAGRGAERAYLQVVSGNAPAERLYDRLGFREEYRYWYRRKA